jgi:hypothetical protein
VSFPQLLRDDQVKALAHDVGCRIPEDLRRSFVPQSNDSVRVSYHDASAASATTAWASHPSVTTPSLLTGAVYLVLETVSLITLVPFPTSSFQVDISVDL